MVVLAPFANGAKYGPALSDVFAIVEKSLLKDGEAASVTPGGGYFGASPLLALVVNVKFTFCDWPELSVQVMTVSSVCTADGGPVTAPVDELIDIPVGWLAMDHEYGAVPPAAVDEKDVMGVLSVPVWFATCVRNSCDALPANADHTCPMPNDGVETDAAPTGA